MLDFLGAIKDPEFRSAVAQGLKEAANRSAASFFGGPVDLATMAMRPLGYSTPDRDVVGSSEWIGKQMEQRGIVSTARNPVAEFLASVAVPAGMASAAPALFRAEQQAVKNAMLPRALDPQAGAILWHGSNSPSAIKEINSGGVFGGLFASKNKTSAQSHGDSLYRMTVPDESIFPVDADVDYDDILDVVRKNTRESGDYEDEIAEAIASGKVSAFDLSIPEDDLLKIFRADSIGEADWEMQRLRGILARKLGYKAVEMPDEHGLSYLVLPGTKVRPVK